MALALPVVDPVLRVVGLTLLSLLVAVVVATGYRWYVRDRVPGGVTLLAGVSAVALYLNTQGALRQVVEGQTQLFAWESVLFNTLAFVLAALVTVVGQRVGDRLAVSVAAMVGVRELEGEVSTLVRTVGRLLTVTLPDQVDDIPGYDPASPAVKETLAGTTLVFPRSVTVDELQTRLRTRIKDDHDVAYVDVDVTDDGTVEYLALGQRIAGIGPTLGPGTAAIAIEGDPPNAASAGDVVQLWHHDDEWRRVGTAEVRGVAGDVVTVALDEEEARSLAGGRARMVTVPSAPTAEREFAGLLRAAEETMAAIRVDPTSDLVDETVGALGVTVVAIKPASESIEAAPPRSRPLAANDLVYVVARPATIRHLEASAAGT